MRRTYDPQSQRTIFAPSRPIKRSQKEVAELDAELRHRAYRIGGGYQPIEIIEEEEEEPEAQKKKRSTGRPKYDEYRRKQCHYAGDNLLILDLSKYHTEGKDAHYIQINHIVGKLTENKKLTDESMKKAEFNFLLDSKFLISKTVIYPEVTRV